MFEKVKIEVIDTGIGIRQQDKRKLFQLFGSIKDEKQKINTNGIGLGLVISKLIVNKFEGEINFSSVFEKGSNFNFTFEVSELCRDDVMRAEE